MLTAGQAIRNAIEAERAAARFYEYMQRRASDPETREFFGDMLAQELAHADSIAFLAERLETGELPIKADDPAVVRVETAPGWLAAEAVGLEDALRLALEGERNAALYYDALADCFDGEVEAFFRELMVAEEEHAEQIEALLERLG